MMINVPQIKFISMNLIVPPSTSTSSSNLFKRRKRKNIIENGKRNSRNVYTNIYII